MRPAERFSRVGPESDTPESRPPASDAPAPAKANPATRANPPCQQAPLSQPGQGLGPVQTFDVLDEGEDAVANPLVS